MENTTNDFFETIEESALEAIKTSGNHSPALLFMNKQKEIIYLDLPYIGGTEQQKDMIVIFMKIILHNAQATAAAIITEAWFYDNEKGDSEKEFKKYGSVSAIPDKKEGLMINCMTQEKNWLVMYEIIRGEGNEFVLGKKDWGEATRAEGRFANLLK